MMPGYSLWVVTIVIIVLIVWIAIMLRTIRNLNNRLSELKDAQYSEVIRTIDHHRHDWMNELQVLFGYIQLNKRDKLMAYIEKISDQMRCNGLISKLGIPFLSAYFISFRASTKDMVLDVRLEHEIQLARYGEQGVRVAHFIISVVEAYESAARSGEGDANQLSINMHVWDSHLFIGFEFDGNSDIDRLKFMLQENVERISKGQDIHVTMEETEQAVDIEVRIRLSEMMG
jgi:stage 0 sporulation protein B (sporulation initiation phosphotransferase)